MAGQGPRGPLHVTFGNKGLCFITRLGAKIIVAGVRSSAIRPHLEKLVGPGRVMLDRYIKGKIDEVYMVFTTFINTMKQEVSAASFPLTADRLQEADRTARGGWDYLYEPDAKTVLEGSCCAVTSRPSSTRRSRRTSRASSRRAWWP